jgi:ribosome-associated heat shock protein Hsp15
MARPQRGAILTDTAARGLPGGAPPPTQRIDRFLWFARLAANRSAAQTLAERAIVRLNGRRVDRAHQPVRPGDLLTLPVGTTVRVLRIIQLPLRRGPPVEARTLYELIEPGEQTPAIDIDAAARDE